MKSNAKLKIYGLFSMALFWATFFSAIINSMPTYVPFVLAVLLILSSFFFALEVERLFKQHLEKKELPPLDFSKEDSSLEEEANKIRKGSFILQRNTLSLLEEKLTSKQEIEEGFSVLHEAILKSIKASIRYDRDNTNQIIEALKANAAPQTRDAEKKILDVLTQLAEETSTGNKLLQEVLSKLEQVASRPITVEATALPTPQMIEEAVVEPTIESEAVVEPVIEPEPEPVVEAAPEPAPAPTPQVTDPNKAMSPDEIAALFAASAPEPEPVVEAAPEPAPAPTPQVTDPNKAMSPDEIAALINSLGV